MGLNSKQHATSHSTSTALAVGRLAFCILAGFEAVSSSAAAPRVRRQDGILCSGNQFATNILRTIITANVEVIRRAEPIPLGDGDNLGVLKLTNGRAYNVHTVRPFGLIDSDCTSDDRWIRTVIPLAMDAPEFHFDWELPGRLAGGVFVLSFEKLAANITLEVPKAKIKGQEQTRVADFKAVARQGLSFGKPGLTSGFSAVLATLFTTLNTVAPNVVADLLDILIRRLLQRLIKTTSLPF